jgi:2-haloacid dehalogenase
MAACQVYPADAMLVAANLWDTDGAHCAGLASAWIDRCGSRYPDYFLPLDLEAAARPRAERLAIIRAIEIFIARPVSAQSA